MHYILYDNMLCVTMTQVLVDKNLNFISKQYHEIKILTLFSTLMLYDSAVKKNVGLHEIFLYKLAMS